MKKSEWSWTILFLLPFVLIWIGHTFLGITGLPNVSSNSHIEVLHQIPKHSLTYFQVNDLANLIRLYH